MTNANSLRSLVIGRFTLFWVSLLCAAGITAAQAREIVVYLHPDITGSPIMATDSAGNVLWNERYAPYGERQVKADDGRNSLWYTGKSQDPDTGLSYFGARWYDPVVGRFSGVDPQRFAETNPHSFNRYAYGNNNPYKYGDPDGKAALPFVIVVVGALIIGGGYYAQQTVSNPNAGLVPPAVNNGVPGYVAGALEGMRDAARDPGGFATWVGSRLDSLIFNESNSKADLGGSGKKVSEMSAGERREYYRSKGVPDSQIGPSGFPKIHKVDHPSRKEAKEAAQYDGEGAPMHHGGPDPHYHSTDINGDKKLPNVHHHYPD